MKSVVAALIALVGLGHPALSQTSEKSAKAVTATFYTNWSTTRPFDVSRYHRGDALDVLTEDTTGTLGDLLTAWGNADGEDPISSMEAGATSIVVERCSSGEIVAQCEVWMSLTSNGSQVEWRDIVYLTRGDGRWQLFDIQDGNPSDARNGRAYLTQFLASGVGLKDSSISDD